MLRNIKNPDDSNASDESGDAAELQKNYHKTNSQNAKQQVHSVENDVLDIMKLVHLILHMDSSGYIRWAELEENEKKLVGLEFWLFLDDLGRGVLEYQEKQASEFHGRRMPKYYELNKQCDYQISAQGFER